MSKNILAIETSTLTGSLALLSDEEVRGEITLSVSVQHSERLMPAIDQLLRDAATDISAIDLFAVAKGPGSFTGLRIGIAAAQGLALAGQKPVVGVSTLEALAVNGIFFQGLVVPVLNAFRGEVYRGLYFSSGGYGDIKALRPDQAMTPEALLAELSQRAEKILLIGPGLEVCHETLSCHLEKGRLLLAPSSLNIPRAVPVALLAQKKWAREEPAPLVLPAYLRNPG